MVFKRILAKVATIATNTNKSLGRLSQQSDGRDSQSESSLLTCHCTNMAEEAAERVLTEVHQKPVSSSKQSRRRTSGTLYLSYSDSPTLAL